MFQMGFDRGFLSPLIHLDRQFEEGCGVKLTDARFGQFHRFGDLLHCQFAMVLEQNDLALFFGKVFDRLGQRFSDFLTFHAAARRYVIGSGQEVAQRRRFVVGSAD